MKCIVPAVLLTFAAGCLPATTTVVPGVRGRVVTLDGRPVSGATVSVVSADPESGGPAFEVTTKRDGGFHRRAQTRWVMAVFLPAHAMRPKFIATARHGHFDSHPETFGGDYLIYVHFFGVGKAESFDLGDLVLEYPSANR
jgi:hypothetical protein